MAGHGASKVEISGLMFRAASGSISWTPFLQEVCALLECDKAYIALHDIRGGRAQISESFNLEDHYITSFNEDFHASYPWTKQASFFQAPGLVWPGHQIVTIEDLRPTDFYNLFMAPQAMLHTLHAVLRADGESGFVTELVLTRPPKSDPFGDSEANAVREFAAPAQIALESASGFNIATLAQSAIMASLDEAAIGLALIIDARKSIQANAVFLEHINKLETEGGKTYFQEAPERRPVRLPSEMALAVQDDRHEILLPTVEGAHPITVYVHQIAVQCPLTGTHEAAWCLLTRDPNQDQDFDETSLREAYDLTPAEIRVAAEITSGKRIEELADALKITPSTARTHLKRIFDKTGTGRQSELVRVMLSAARRRRKPTKLESVFQLDLTPKRFLGENNQEDGDGAA